MSQVSAGLLMYRLQSGELQVLLVHPGGPFFRNKDAGAWTIPKGEVQEGEELLATARREFAEEIGVEAEGEFVPLTPVKQKGGKTVHCFAIAGDLDPATIVSNTFQLEWPPKSGRMMDFPEVDRAEWFTAAAAAEKINAAQAAFISELQNKLSHA
jgi:predicted NUDIX family NTP pyrophosphohydrolase